jgi:glycosyltransferase involved in cell wall biosynthesis
MSHDVIADRYARLYEQPYQLALRGHEVLGACLSYRETDARDEVHKANPGSLRWVGLSNGRLGMVGMLLNAVRVFRILREFKPDIIVGASDALHVVLGNWFARMLRVPFAADLYDNFESFGLSRLPGLIFLYRRALAQAAVVTCVSQPLADFVRQKCGAKGVVFSLPSTIDKKIFYPRDRKISRGKLGLPIDVTLIGTAGGLSREKGIEPLYRAFEHLADSDPELHLVLAGPIDPDCPPPKHARVHYLGMLPHAMIPELISALDVAVIYLKDTPYGRYSFPQKAYEIVACNVPVVAASVGVMVSLFKTNENSLYEADNEGDLARVLKAQILSPQTTILDIVDWQDMARSMEQVYLAVQRP